MHATLLIDALDWNTLTNTPTTLKKKIIIIIIIVNICP